MMMMIYICIYIYIYIYIYITGQEFNKLTAETFTVRLAQANLVSKSDNASSIKKTDLDKSELNEVSKNVNANQQKD